MAQQMDRKTQLQSASAISLPDVQTVDTRPLIVSPGMTKTGVAPVFLMSSCAISHTELHCLLSNVVMTVRKLKVVSCLSLYVFM